MMGTLGACNVVGFAPGFAIGIAQAILVHLGWSALDSLRHGEVLRARIVCP